MSRYTGASYWGDEDYDDPYVSPYSYGKKSKSKFTSYSWQPSIWSNYSYGYKAVEDDNSSLFVKDPVTYLTPTKEDIKIKTNIWNEKSLLTIKELARVCYLKMVDEKDYINEIYSDFDSLSENQQMDYTSKKELYDSIFDKFIPGNTPLEQAIAIFRQISSGSEQQRAHHGERDEDADFDTTLNFDRQVYCDPDINEQLEFNELSKERKMDILSKISIVGKLGDQFKVEKEVSEKIVSNSDTYAKKIMRDYAQFSQIELYQKMFPNFSTKFLTKDLTVNVPIDRKEQKQKIIILLDYSGSMDEDEKQIWVNAILIDRLRYVMREEAEVFFSYFVDSTKQLKFHHLKDKEDVTKFWTWFSNRPNGGCTEIGTITEYVSKCVHAGHLHNLDVNLIEEKPEILIINDGQDRVGIEKFSYKVNAISLLEYNPELKDLCVKTGGKQVRVEYTGKVISYSSEGETVVDEGFKQKS
jgi:hypothetical protein